jgi:hypothetical protein
MAPLADWHATAEFRHHQLGQVVDEILSNKERKKQKTKKKKTHKTPKNKQTKTTKEKKKKVPKLTKNKQTKNKTKQKINFFCVFLLSPLQLFTFHLFSLILRFHFLLFSQSGRLWGNHYGWKLLLNSKKVG